MTEGLIDWTAILPSEYIDAFATFLEDHVWDALEEILLETDVNIHYGVTVNALDLLQASVQLGSLLLAHPTHLLPHLDSALLRVQRKIIRERDDTDLLFYKPNMNARLSNLPACPEITKSKLPRAEDVGMMVAVPGTVIRTGMVKMLESVRHYKCNRCNGITSVLADPEQRHLLRAPVRCTKGTGANAEFSRGDASTEGDVGGKECSGKVFTIDSAVCRDYQEIKIQEQVQKLEVGNVPRSINVLLQDDLVDKCKAGDDVVVNGIVLRRWKTVTKDERCDLEMVLVANFVHVNNEQRMGLAVSEEMRGEICGFWERRGATPWRARMHILRSVAPHICGMYLVKLAVLLTLIGGVPRAQKSGMRVRGESHLLIVGDPGTGKSQLLKYAARLSPRAVLTTGIGTTSAGLTVMAVRDTGGEWMLEAGALVLADGGLCCIDEFDSTREHDRAAIHEAMEQQTLSVAKAGLVCKLNTRTSIFAVCNPKGRYDPESALSVNVGIAGPLLSRFDLVFILLDRRDEKWDETVSSFILGGGQTAAIGAASAPASSRRKSTSQPAVATSQGSRSGATGEGAGEEEEEEEERLWSFDQLQSYICYVKATFLPDVTPDASEVLMKYFQMQRQAADRNQARTTIRLLESLIRTAQAHARLMFQHEVAVRDAVVAVSLMESSLMTAALDGVNSLLHADFPDDPEAEYGRLEHIVLEQLGLEHLADTPGGGAGGPDARRPRSPAREAPFSKRRRMAEDDWDDGQDDPRFAQPRQAPIAHAASFRPAPQRVPQAAPAAPASPAPSDGEDDADLLDTLGQMSATEVREDDEDAIAPTAVSQLSAHSVERRAAEDAPAPVMLDDEGGVVQPMCTAGDRQRSAAVLNALRTQFGSSTGTEHLLRRLDESDGVAEAAVVPEEAAADAFDAVPTFEASPSAIVTQEDCGDDDDAIVAPPSTVSRRKRFR